MFITRIDYQHLNEPSRYYTVMPQSFRIGDLYEPTDMSIQTREVGAKVIIEAYITKEEYYNLNEESIVGKQITLNTITPPDMTTDLSISDKTKEAILNPTPTTKNMNSLSYLRIDDGEPLTV